MVVKVAITDDNKTVNVKLLGKEYQVVCPREKQHELMDAAILLDNKMLEIKKSGKIIGLERIAIMAALNISYEYLSSNRCNEKAQLEVENRLNSFSLKLEEKLESITCELETEI